MRAITRFIGKQRFLSNFYPCTIVFMGIKYLSAEQFFQTAKAQLVGDRKLIRLAATAKEARKEGRACLVRIDWDDIRLDVMYLALALKFSEPKLREKLLSTKDAALIEGNWWGDTYWGVCNGKGHNHLGRLLMELRARLQLSS